MAPADRALERQISASLLRLRINAPFFAALSLFASFRPSLAVPTAATDGRAVYYNPDFLGTLAPRELDGVLLHEVLHAALLHAVRRGTREGVRWNVAADVVVNGILAKQAFLDLPKGGIRAADLEHLRVEEIYELISARAIEGCPSCLTPGPGIGEDGSSARKLAEIEVYWQRALRQAEAVARGVGQGNMPAGADRLLDELGRAQIDWRSQLWRFLVRTPADFSGFDRRLLSRKLYLETLEGDSLRAFVAVDTSGSVSPEQLGLLLTEIGGILGAYPHIEAELYYADTALYGPFSIEEQIRNPTPVGGGGTSFIPFFDRVRDEHGREEAVCLYLTDGLGAFPPEPPDLPVLWVVTAGGLPDEAFPFGEVVRLLRD